MQEPIFLAIHFFGEILYKQIWQTLKIGLGTSSLFSKSVRVFVEKSLLQIDNRQ